MTKSKSEGVKGLPKLPTALKVLFELYVTLDVWSPYCLYTRSVVNRQYVLNLRQKARWLRVFIDKLEQGAEELLLDACDYGTTMVEQQHVEPQLGDRDVQLGIGDPGVSSSETGLFEEEQGRVDAPQEAEAPVAAYEAEGIE